MMCKWSVYAHINKINGKIYIGITKRKVEERWKNGNGYNGQHFYKAIKKYGWENFEHIILLDGLSQDMAELVEIELIKKYKTLLSENGYNSATGGRVNCGFKITDEAKLKMSKAHKGKKHTEEAKRRISKYQRSNARRKNMSNETKEKISLIMRSKNTKKVYQYSLDGNLIKVWNSVACAARENQYEIGQIASCCRGDQKTAFNYIWLYNMDDRVVQERIRTKRRKLSVRQVNEIRERYKTGRYSYSDLATFYGVDKSNIGRIIRNEAYSICNDCNRGGFGSTGVQ